jgi:hypothetical protein
MSPLVAKVVAVAVGAVLLSGSPAAASYSIAGVDSEPGSPSRAAARPVRDAPAHVTVSVPRVAFTSEVRVVGERLRTPVLANASATPGIALVIGARDACLRSLTPGEVAWIDCRVPTRGPVVVVVMLRDGTLSARVARS